MTTSQCEKCPLGSYQNSPGSISCKKCPDGTEATLEGQTACMGKGVINICLKICMDSLRGILL